MHSLILLIQSAKRVRRKLEKEGDATKVHSFTDLNSYTFEVHQPIKQIEPRHQ